MSALNPSSRLSLPAPILRVPRGRFTIALIALAIYLLGAIVTQLHGIAHLQSGCACYGTDPTLFMWAMAWWPHALLHLPHNPFITQEIWAPGGLNLAGNTSVPTLALLGMPITALFGPVATYNLWSILAPVTGAFCAYRLCLAITGRQAASVAGGWLYGFSTFAVTQLMGHLHLVFTFAAPALVLLCIRRADATISTRRFVILTTCVLVAQMGISTEVLLTLTCAGVILGLAVLVCAPADGRRALLALTPWLALAYAITAILTSPFLYYALKSPAAAVPGAANLGADLPSFVVPPVSTWLGGSAWAHVTQYFRTGPAEDNAYLGFPLIAMVLLACGRLLGDWRLRALLLAGLILALWSLGAYVTIQGGQHQKLPYEWVAGSSVFKQVIPVRISAFVALATAVAAALFLAGDLIIWPLRWLLLIGAVVFLFPNPSAPEYNTRFVVPPFFAEGTWRQYIAPGEVVLPLPFGENGSSLLWQTQTHFAFPLASGDFTQPAPAPYLAQPVMPALLSPAAPPANLGPALREFLTEQHVGAIVVQDGAAPGWTALLRSLRFSGTDRGGVTVYRLRAPL